MRLSAALLGRALRSMQPARRRITPASMDVLPDADAPDGAAALACRAGAAHGRNSALRPAASMPPAVTGAGGGGAAVHTKA